jgi:hypothetical protein
MAFVLFSTNASSQRIKYTGQIIDYDTHKPIQGITIQIQGKKYSAITDSAGRFSLILPIDSYTLTITAVGYVKLLYPIYILDKTFEVIYLKRAPPNELQEVTVETIKRDAAIKDLQMSNIHISPSQLKKSPLLFGEADILRALTLQPGIITGGETVSSYYVRGGDADQNLILLDGAPIFNIAHLLGFYSGINADAVQDINFYKAGIPAQYGSRLSSIMLLNAKTGNPDSLRFNVGAGLVSSHFLINGPIIKKKLTVMASTRIAYPKLMMNLFPGDVAKSDAFYYDDIVKLSYIPNGNNRVNFTFYNSYDKYKFPGDTSYKWKNYVGSLNWRSTISQKFSFNLSGNFSKYYSYINGLDKTYAYVLGSSIQQKEARAAFNFNIADGQKIIFGGGIVHYTIEPGELNPASDSSSIAYKKIDAENANELSAFISSENRITKFLELQIGARFTQYNYLGPRQVFSYTANEPKTIESITDTIVYGKNQTIKSYNGIEPRLLLLLLLNKSTSIKLSYNRTQQYLHLITNTTSVTPVDYWKLSDEYIKPETADQYAIGLFKNFSDNIFETSVEGYYKNIQNSVEYKNGANLALNPALETQLLPAKGYAYGVELSIKKNKGILTGMGSYTFSRTFTKVLTSFTRELVNEGEYFPGNVDRPHNLVLSGTVSLGKGWQFSSNFVYTSGRPATYPDGSYIINGSIITNYSVRNEDRLPAYHRLDVSFSYDSRRYPQQRRYSILNFSFYNVYMHKNVYSVYFKRNGSQIQAYQLSVIGTIVPSISWNYNF